MSARYSFDEKIMTNAFAYIERNKIDYVSLVLDQSFGEHHTFSIVMDYDTLKQDFVHNPLERMKLIGRFLDIEIQQGKENGGAYVFRGIIQDVYHQDKEGKHGYLVLSGNSPTIQLERGKCYDIFCNMTLQHVFEEVTSEIINKRDRLPCVNKPIYDGQVRFLMQYNESDWDFLCRLSSISGETLYYTGMDLVFGTHKDWKATEVSYDNEIIDFKFGSRLLANNFSRYQYLSENDDTISQNSPERINDANEYVKMASNRSKELTERRPVVSPLSILVDDIGSLTELVSREKVTNAASTIYVQGVAKTCAPRIGRLLTINMPANMTGASDLGTYRITKVKHIIDQNQRYTCEFEGVPADLKFVPTPDVKQPIAESIRATVIRNDDPQGQGRVRVEFPFVQDRASEVWLRVMTPNAGSSDVVGTNRGIVFVPEKGDQVMVGFEFGDPNQPYVMGSLFHGKNGTGGQKDNHVKSIITRQGHTIEFDDAEESLSITIKDKKGNFLHIDSKGNNIEITSLETITMKAKDIRMEASNNIEMQAEADIRVDAIGTAHLGSQGNLDIVTESDMQIKSMASTSLMAKAEMKMEGVSTKISNQSETKVVGVDTSIKGQTTTVSGAGHKIEIM